MQMLFYTGKEKNEESSLYYCEQRYYAAHISRWVSTDPTWLEDGINIYAYVHGPPLSGVDPSGTQTDEYYLARKIDYELRHPGQKAPDYYEEYGNVYLHKFKYDTRESLSLKGKTWNDSALVKLQRPIESMIKITQGKIEENPDVFRAFAFEMHPDAYIKAGFYSLSIVDWAKIGLTPSFDHLFSEEGAQQICKVAKECFSMKFNCLVPIMKKTVERLLP